MHKDTKTCKNTKRCLHQAREKKKTLIYKGLLRKHKQENMRVSTQIIQFRFKPNTYNKLFIMITKLHRTLVKPTNKTSSSLGEET